MKSVIVRFALMATMSCIAREAAAQDTAAEPFRYEELGAGAFAAVVNLEVPSYAFANSLVIIGTSQVLVVDTQQNPQAAAALLAEIRRRTSLPIGWVVNTHWHGDHVFGNGVYRAADERTRIIAHPLTRDSIRIAGSRAILEQREQARQSAARLRARLEQAPAPDREPIARAIEVRERYARMLDTLRLTEPDLLIADRMAVDLGGIVVEIHHPGPAHTPGDLIVSVPSLGIVAAGDLLEDGALWLRGADVAGWRKVLEQLRASAPAVLLPSHGKVHRDHRLIDAQSAFLDDLVALGARLPARDTAAVISGMDTHRGTLDVWGVSGDRFDALVLEGWRELVQRRGW
jgi:cyclase